MCPWTSNYIWRTERRTLDGLPGPNGTGWDTESLRIVFEVH